MARHQVLNRCRCNLQISWGLDGLLCEVCLALDNLFACGQSFCMWPNSLHLKQWILSLLKDFPATLGCFIVRLLSNFPNGLQGLKHPLFDWNFPRQSVGKRSAIRLVKTSAMCKVSPVKVSLKPSSRLGYEGLKRLSGRLAIQVQVMQSLSELRQFFPPKSLH